jgi:signal transduction histidine kinase
MSAAARESTTASPDSRTGPSRELYPHLFAAGLLAGVLVSVARDWTTLRSTVVGQWPDLLFWAVLIIVIDLFPVKAEGPQLSLDMPVLLAVALLYPPVVAVVVALVAAIDIRELRGRVSVTRALFNRSQVAISVLIAAQTFTWLGGAGYSWPATVAATAAAVVASYLANVGLVSTYRALREDVAWLQSAFHLTVGAPLPFLVAYLGYGVLALVLARIFVEAGPWPVAIFLIPILVARQMLVQTQKVQAIASQLRERERLLEMLLDRMLDERRDERLRIAADLHDDLLQLLTYVWMCGKQVQKGVGPQDLIADDAQELVQAADLSLNKLRDLIRELHDIPATPARLVPTLRSLIRDLKLDSGVAIELAVDDRVSLPLEAQSLLYQVARESLANALRHSHASRVSVSLFCDDKEVTLEVSDNGSGFEPEATRGTNHFGIGLMRERVRLAGGAFELKTAAGRGTTIRVKVPRHDTSDNIEQPKTRRGWHHQSRSSPGLGGRSRP